MTFAHPYGLCVCAVCGPPWRLIILKPKEDAPMLEKLSWGSWMALCPTCGNKRCPGAANHENQCTGSNETGQPGSLYALTLADEVAAGLHDSPHP